MLKKLSFDELDDSFFTGLHDGSFILVLGAGFSYGIPNQAGGTIPIGSAFAELTKKRFNRTDSPSYSEAAEIWESRSKKDNNLLDEFKTHFLVDEAKFNINEYSSVFLPNWYNIYTLNFDNVLEFIQDRSSFRKKKIVCFPNDTVDTEDPDIIHLHGLISGMKSFSDLVFTPDSYTNLNLSSHTLYDPLHGDIRSHHKHVVIVGSQFKEQIIRHLFFKGLPLDKSVKIFHFDIETTLQDVNEFAERDYYFIKLDQTQGVKQFLQFLRKNKDRIENIQIDGAEVINPTFKRKKGEKTYSRTEFYTAKDTENCQWYGIIHDFDIRRQSSDQIKTIAINCFGKELFRKVVAVVSGFGGSGKSTMLRRLAIELIGQPFQVIWLKDRDFNHFYTKGLWQIKDDSERNYLLIIEDWYRIDPTEQTKEFLRDTQTIPNLRIIIGDRDTMGRDYLDELADSNNQIVLNPAENKTIINDIFRQNPKWKSLFTEDQITSLAQSNTSLFLTLFIIMRVIEDQLQTNVMDFTDSSAAFRSIIKSDLKKIGDKAPGVAQAMHQWACIYANYKLLIDFNAFLAIVDRLSVTRKDSTSISNWNVDNYILKRVNIYLNNTKSLYGGKKGQSDQYIRFHHDVLAEEGLAQISIGDWQPIYDPVERKYDNLLLRNLTDMIIEYGNNQVSSNFLSAMLLNQKQIFNYDQDNLSQDKLAAILKLYNKKNFHPNYLNYLWDRDIPLEDEKRLTILTNLLKEQSYPQQAWLAIFNGNNSDIKSNAATTILSVPNSRELNEILVRAAFKFEGTGTESNCDLRTAKASAAKNILDDKALIWNKPELVVAALNLKGRGQNPDAPLSEAKLKTAISILSDPGISRISGHLVRAAFIFEGIGTAQDVLLLEAKIKAAISILSDPGISRKSEHLVRAVFKFEGHGIKPNYDLQAAKASAAKSILDDKALIWSKPELVLIALNLKETDTDLDALLSEAKLETSITILADPGISRISEHLVRAAFKFEGHGIESNYDLQTAKASAAKNILDDEALIWSKPELVLTALNLNETDTDLNSILLEAKFEAVLTILTDMNILELNQNMVIAAFKFEGTGKETDINLLIAKYKLVKLILSDRNLHTKFRVLVSIALNWKGMGIENDPSIKPVKTKLATDLLENVHWNTWDNITLTLGSLRYFSSGSEYPEIVNHRINEIIASFIKNPRERLNQSFYLGLMSIDFSHNPDWNQSAKYIIERWNTLNRSGINCVLYSHQSKPAAVRQVCESILKTWETEIKLSVFIKVNTYLEGYHLRHALGHPFLREKAKETAIEMVQKETQTPGFLPDYLKVIAQNISDKNEYPVWGDIQSDTPTES